MSDSVQPYELQPARLLCPWDFPGKNTGMGCRALLRGISPTQGSNWHLSSPAVASRFFTTSATDDYVNKKCQHLGCVRMFFNLTIIRDLLQNLDSEACGARILDQLGLRSMETRLMEQMAALQCVCAGVCILAMVLTPFSSLALYPSFNSEAQMSARTFPFCLGVGFCHL